MLTAMPKSVGVAGLQTGTRQWALQSCPTSLQVHPPSTCLVIIWGSERL